MDNKMKEIMDGICENLTDEQKKKAKQCKTMDELMALAGEWGLELPDEALDAVAGGGCRNCNECRFHEEMRIEVPPESFE